MKLLFLILVLNLSIYCQTLLAFTNALIHEQSPYLKQHGTNPVNWTIWNKKAFLRAKKEQKLIFVSIGYSTCHWCHVMEEESFKNIKIANLLNKNYISIKVDREQSPYLDTSYQLILKRLKKRRNGWPLNFILNHKKEIIYITTYIPPTFKYGVEGMISLLPRIANEYKTKNKKLFDQMSNYKNILFKKIKDENSFKSDTNLTKNFVLNMKNRYDKIYKGFDKNPKFPLASNINFLLDIYSLEKDKDALKMAIESLKAMSYGGIYDQISGGFYRYSVYANWSIPHFEKMLYTQAELILLYNKAYKLKKNELFKDTVIKSIKEINIRFRTKNGLYYSASNADSLNKENKKQEGYYFTYFYEDSKNNLLFNNIKNSDEILDYLGFEDFGNFEDELNNPFIRDAKIKEPKNLKKALLVLKKIREEKKFPFIDKKIITSWNAMMIKSLFYSSYIDNKYLIQANKSLATLLKQLYINKKLYHQKLADKIPIEKALLEDYSFVIDLLLTSYKYTFNKKHLNLAKELITQSINKFYKNKKWYLEDNKEYAVDFSDKYYIASVSKHFHNIMSYANLNYDLNLLHKSKQFIKEQKNRILSNNNSAEAQRAILKLKYPQIIIKSKKINLLKNMKALENITYANILLKEEDTNNYLACDEKSCFAFEKDLNKLIKIVDK